MVSKPTKEIIDKLKYENQMQEKGYKLIAGTDEVGRGPLAGPVVCATVVMPLDNIIEGVDDSKKLSEKKREELYEKIINVAIDYKIEFIDNTIIDEINILEATKICMANSINNLKVKPDVCLVDAVSKLNTDVEIVPIIKGDFLSYSIGAASIIAKVARDRYMCEMDKKYLGYNFAKHKGYGTKEHIEKIFKLGLSQIHRKSFCKFYYSKLNIRKTS